MTAMPKISAPTVAEHRANRRAALIRAGETALREGGLAAVTPGQVCERADLSRSSFYDYFTTRDDLLVAMAIEAMELWNADLEQQMADVEPGLPALRTFVAATMSMSADGRHDIAGALREVQLSPNRMDDLMELHDLLLRPLVNTLGDLGVAEPSTTAMLVNGVLAAGVQLVSHGVSHRTVTDDVYGLITRGILG